MRLMQEHIREAIETKIVREAFSLRVNWSREVENYRWERWLALRDCYDTHLVARAQFRDAMKSVVGVARLLFTGRDGPGRRLKDAYHLALKLFDASDIEKCGECDEEVNEEALEMGWPIANLKNIYVCPSCYGAGGYCPEGHVLSATDDSDHCEKCEDTATT